MRISQFYLAEGRLDPRMTIDVDDEWTLGWWGQQGSPETGRGSWQGLRICRGEAKYILQLQEIYLAICLGPKLYIFENI